MSPFKNNGPEIVYLYNLNDILYWIKKEPDFGKQAIYLDERYLQKDFDPQRPGDLQPSMTSLYQQGVRYIAPPIWVLLATSSNNQMVASEYAKAANAAGLKIITWSLERDGSLVNGGGWYYQTVKNVIHDDSQTFQVLHVLAQEVGIKGIFSDWPATVTYYANCMGLD